MIPIGTVQLSGILGKPTVCPLVRIQVRLVENLLGDTVSLGSAPKAIVTCAVLEAAAEDLILPIAVIDKLRKMINSCDENEKSDSYVTDTLTEANHDVYVSDAQSNQLCDVNTVTRSGLSTDQNATASSYQPLSVTDSNNDNVVNDDVIVDDTLTDVHHSIQDVASRDSLIAEQKSDPTLQHCWKLLARKKGNFCLQEGILMRLEKILGQFLSISCTCSKEKTNIGIWSRPCSSYVTEKELAKNSIEFLVAFDEE